MVDLCKEACILLVGPRIGLKTFNHLLLLRHKTFSIGLFLLQIVVFVFHVVEDVDALLQV